MPGEDVHRALLDVALHRVPEVAELGKEFLEGLYRGVVEPDKVLDTTFSGHPIKHHAENSALINYYYLLSLYHYRRGDRYVSGICLGRALHYIHDSSIMYREEAEHTRIEHDMKRLVKDGADVQKLCNNSSTTEQHTKAVEAFCTAYKRSVDMLKSFAEEISKPIDVEEVRKRYRRARLRKTVAVLALFILSPFTLFLSIPPALLIGFLYVPDAYIDAMKAGIAKTISVTNVKTAY